METDVQAPPRTAYARFFKPLLDRVVGFVFAVIALPILVLLLLLAWIAFGWPPLLRVSRVGRNNTRFNMYRINTRKDYQTDLRGRRLKLSLSLRRTSLDELPQLWNVAFGHMSLVGPRPLHPLQAVEMEEAFASRNLARPGLTGPWQIEARGDGRDQVDHLDIDVAYLENVSFKTDLGIAFRTLPALIRADESS